MQKYKDAHYRSLIKALSWRVCATVSTMLIVFAFTRQMMLSIGIGVVEVVIKLLLYYFHERAWLKIPMGKKQHPLSSLPVERDIKDEDYVVIQNKLKELGYIEG